MERPARLPPRPGHRSPAPSNNRESRTPPVGRPNSRRSSRHSRDRRHGDRRRHDNRRRHRVQHHRHRAQHHLRRAQHHRRRLGRRHLAGLRPPAWQRRPSKPWQRSPRQPRVAWIKQVWIGGQKIGSLCSPGLMEVSSRRRGMVGRGMRLIIYGPSFPCGRIAGTLGLRSLFERRASPHRGFQKTRSVFLDRRHEPA